MIERNCTKNCWFVAHNGVDVYHLFDVKAGQRVLTGQPNLDECPDRETALAAIPEQYRPEEDV